MKRFILSPSSAPQPSRDLPTLYSLPLSLSLCAVPVLLLLPTIKVLRRQKAGSIFLLLNKVDLTSYLTTPHSTDMYDSTGFDGAPSPFPLRHHSHVALLEMEIASTSKLRSSSATRRRRVVTPVLYLVSSPLMKTSLHMIILLFLSMTTIFLLTSLVRQYSKSHNADDEIGPIFYQ